MRAPKPTSSFKLPGPGFHRGVLQSIIDLGIQPSNNPQYDPGHKLMLIFELPDTLREDGTRETVKTTQTFSMGKKANLRKIVEQWAGKSFPNDQAAWDFELSGLLGKPVYLQITHKDSNGKTYANITAYGPLPGGVEKPMLQAKPVLYDQSRDDATDVYHSLPEWIRNIIDKQIPKESAQPASATAAAGASGDDDIPF